MEQENSFTNLESIIKPSIDQELKNKEQEKYSELNFMFRTMLKHYGINFFDEVMDFIEKLQAKYPDFRDYQLTHILAYSGGGVNAGPVENFEKFDFPDELSIEKYIRERYQKYLAGINQE